MPRYYFHLHNDLEALDEEGREFPDLEAARAEAIRGARDLLAEDVRRGAMTLSHWIEVQDEGGTRLLAIRYGEVVQIIS